MGFKFNRGCWVESLEGALLRRAKEKREGEVREFDDNVTQRPTEQNRRPEKARQLSTEETIHLSRTLLAAYGKMLLFDFRVTRLLRQLKADIDVSREVMIELGIARACARCDKESHYGSCCSSGLEKKYDAVLLLINLLMGVTFNPEPSRSGSCRFLGDFGCTLPVRHMLCVDYLCPDLEKELGHAALVRMQEATGPEIESCFRLMEAIKGIILGEDKQ